MTFESLLIEYGPGVVAGLLLGLFPLILGLRSRQYLFATISELVCIVCGGFFALIGAILASLVFSMLLYFRMKLLRDDEKKQSALLAAHSIEAKRQSATDEDRVKSFEQKIFITASNTTGAPFATMLFERLTKLNYRVVTDNISLTPELQDFGVETILDQATDVIALLTPDCFAQGGKLDVGGDITLQEELGYAISQEKNIISIIMPGFEWPDTLPRGLGPMRYMNGVKANTQRIDAVIERILYLLTPVSEKADTAASENPESN